MSDSLKYCCCNFTLGSVSDYCVLAEMMGE
uniref:Uncharacterized protein n=1 Tax=Anguilla anguilla TaxID=7936 RepID=A0A0E9S7Y7_ANGAN